MSIGGKFEFVGITKEGVLAIDWQTEKGDSGQYMFDLERFEHTDRKVGINLVYPKDIRKPMINSPKMNVRIAAAKGGVQKDGTRYLLKWETQHGGFSQHAPKVMPERPLSALVLLKIQ